MALEIPLIYNLTVDPNYKVLYLSYWEEPTRVRAILPLSGVSFLQEGNHIRLIAESLDLLLHNATYINGNQPGIVGIIEEIIFTILLELLEP